MSDISYFTFCWVCKKQQQLLDDVCNTCKDGGRLETIGVEKVATN